MIKVKNVTKEFSLSRKQRKELGDQYKTVKTVRAVDDVSFECNPGRIFGLLGPNGAGKTTWLHLCAGLIQPKEGNGSVMGHDLWSERTEIRKKAGLLSHGTGLYGDLTVLENIVFWSQIAGVEKSEIENRISWALKRMDLNSKLQSQKLDLYQWDKNEEHP